LPDDFCDDRAFSESEQSRHIRKQISHLCMRFFNKRYLRITVETSCTDDPLTGKSRVNSSNISGFLSQGNDPDFIPESNLGSFRFRDCAWPGWYVQGFGLVRSLYISGLRSVKRLFRGFNALFLAFSGSISVIMRVSSCA